MSVEFCNYCGIFHPNAHECPKGPKPLEQNEFTARLIEAGWTKAEAEEEWQSIQEERENCE